MNGTFLRGQALTLAKAVKGDDQTAQLRDLYRKILSREPTAKEIDLALSYLASGSLAEYAHVLLSTNEVLFQK
jgi:hypothetical protein